MNIDLLIDDVLKEKANNEILVLPINLDAMIKKTIEELPEQNRKRGLLNKSSFNTTQLEAVRIAGILLLTISLILGSGLVTKATLAHMKKTLKEHFKNSELFTPEIEQSINNNLTEEQIEFYKYVQTIKDENPNLTAEELVKLIDWQKHEEANKRAREKK